MPSVPHGPIRSYGRIKARALKPRQERFVEELLPRLAVDLTTGAIDLATLFPPPHAGEVPSDARGRGLVTESPLRLAGLATSAVHGVGKHVLEVGFGGGEHLVAQAKAAPDHGFIGVEPFLNGVGSCLRHIDEAGVTNVRLHMGDARDVLAALPDAALYRVDILFPDPWPKSRHWKRRLVQADFVAALARVLKPGGGVRFATDWANYAEWTLEIFLREPRFAWTAERAVDWTAPWPGHVTTRYEEKKLGDCAPVWLAFLRRES